MRSPTPKALSWTSGAYRDALSRHFRYFIPKEASVLEIGCGSGGLLCRLPNVDVTGVDIDAEALAEAKAKIPHGQFFHQSGETLDLTRCFDVIILSDTLSLAQDIHAILVRAGLLAHERTRLIINFQNQLWRPILALATHLGLRRDYGSLNWLAPKDVETFLAQADWWHVSRTPVILCPLPFLGLDRLLNRFLAPFLSLFCLSNFVLARPARRSYKVPNKHVSIVVPARNEAGNIGKILERIPTLGTQTEIIFVEGGSSDSTWEEIGNQIQRFPEKTVRAFRQSGKGKANAMHEGFAQASGDILMILDADLSTAAEDLPRFYELIASNRVEFANGSRLVYPMEKRAMNFSNMCANKFFAFAFRWLLGQSVKDTLCGTKAFRRDDYLRILAERSYFGNFDPFGDFELLFGASKLGLEISDVAIRYRERTYGQSNIRRIEHGLVLLRMVMFAARRIKFIG